MNEAEHPYSDTSIHTLNARGDITLEIARNYFQLTTEQMFNEIQALFDSTRKALKPKGVDYSQLKTALIPSQKQNDMAFVFDVSSVTSSFYGFEVFERLLPLFNPESKHSVLVGDYLHWNGDQEFLLQTMKEALRVSDNAPLSPNVRYFVVYISNLTKSMVEEFDNGLNGWNAYCGVADMTHASTFKALLSTMLVNAFVKCGKQIIQGHEDDVPNSEDHNVSGYPFKKYGFTCLSVQSLIFGTMLSYKIERPVIPGFEADTELSLNALSPVSSGLDVLEVEVKSAKLKYLKSNKADKLAKAGLQRINEAELAQLIRSRLSLTYFYNLTLKKEHDAATFNVSIELPREDGEGSLRYLAALKYEPSVKKLTLVTLY